jgi:hypothetical protein
MSLKGTEYYTDASSCWLHFCENALRLKKRDIKRKMLFCKKCGLLSSQNSLVSLVPNDGLYGWVQLPAKEKFLSSPHTPDQLWGSPSLTLKG